MKPRKPKYEECVTCGTKKNTARAKTSKFCKKCSQQNKGEKKYLNQDVIFVEHKAGNRKNQRVVKFKDTCPSCKKDKGYVFKNAINKPCLSCNAKKSFVEGRETNHNFYAKREYVLTPSQGIVSTRSSYETFYLKYLNSNKINYFYEPKRFTLSDGSSYLPDVFLIDENKFIELKGRDRPEDVIKYEKFKKEYPEIKIEKLKKRDLILLGYNQKCYQEYRYCHINSENWKIVVLDVKDFEKTIGTDCDAITLTNEKEIYFRIDKLDSKTIMHEIGHVYHSLTSTDRIGLTQEQSEEFLCEFVSNNIFKMLFTAMSIQELIEDICNLKYNLDIKINYLDMDLTEEQFNKLKKALLRLGFRFKEPQDFDMFIQKMKICARLTEKMKNGRENE